MQNVGNRSEVASFFGENTLCLESSLRKKLAGRVSKWVVNTNTRVLMTKKY